MNGAVTGMEIIAALRRPILRAHLQAMTACAVVVVGAAMCGSAECRIASPKIHLIATTIAGFVWPYSLKCEVDADAFLSFARHGWFNCGHSSHPKLLQAFLLVCVECVSILVRR